MFYKKFCFGVCIYNISTVDVYCFFNFKNRVKMFHSLLLNSFFLFCFPSTEAKAILVRFSQHSLFKSKLVVFPLKLMLSWNFFHYMSLFGIWIRSSIPVKYGFNLVLPLWKLLNMAELELIF